MQRWTITMLSHAGDGMNKYCNNVPKPGVIGRGTRMNRSNGFKHNPGRNDRVWK